MDFGFLVPGKEKFQAGSLTTRINHLLCFFCSALDLCMYVRAACACFNRPVFPGGDPGVRQGGAVAARVGAPVAPREPGIRGYRTGEVKRPKYKAIFSVRTNSPRFAMERRKLRDIKQKRDSWFAPVVSCGQAMLLQPNAQTALHATGHPTLYCTPTLQVHTPPTTLVQEYNCAMMACVTGGEHGRALDLLEQMKANKGGVNAGPDIVTYTSAIMACSSKGERATRHWTG